MVLIVLELVVGHLQPIRHDQRRGRSDNPVLEGRRDSDHLVDRAGLVHIDQCRVVLAVDDLAGVGDAHVGEGQHITGLRVAHGHDPRLGARVRHRPSKRALDEVLEGTIEREDLTGTALRRDLVLHAGRDLLSDPVALHEQLARLALQTLLEAHLEPTHTGLLGAVDASEDRPGEVACGVDPTGFLLEGDAVELEPTRGVGCRLVEAAGEDDVATVSLDAGRERRGVEALDRRTF